ncbi:MAG: ATPase [Microbacterium sp. SCN 70-200]|uniref:MinD/ParA family ATP-binding protein n=1 Tax=unclassified Microbacterium TaxID=2609290 RepID=UPI00086E7464|nr:MULTISPECIES: MinD/ParA family protein [unclassified Microbacterium]MBN9215965.1 MinD/ParA family protein [Microbacterium sp.]ODT41844.1 MAG: ATPase [Microbacterium sp. SCN 70-200]OJV84533.1 MAG: ATPase [Microbacterium sp. 70-16]
MASERNDSEPDEVDNGVLAAPSGLETTGIGIVEGATAQVDVSLPTPVDDDDDLLDDEVAPAAVAPAAPERGVTAVSGGSGAAGGSAAAAAGAGRAAATAKGASGASASAAKPGSTVAARSAAEVETAERLRPRTTEITLQSRRLGDFEADRESPDLLTPDRLLDPAHVVRPEPEGAWRHLVYTLSGRRINLGDSKRAVARKALDRRIAAPLAGGAKFVPVLSRKGGVGKTTVTTLLGMALADAREDRIIAVDANPDRGTLAERVGRPSGKTVRDLVRTSGDVHGFNDISQIVARDHTRLDVLASDADPHVSEAFSDTDYQDVADIAAHFYSVVLTDTGTGIVHSVMQATLDRADEIVIVAGLSVDEARLASETLTWLESNGYAERVRNAVVVLNTARPGAALVRADELDAHFRSRVRAVVRVPYDPHIASGSAISFRDLQPETREAARQLAAIVVEGLRLPAAV